MEPLTGKILNIQIVSMRKEVRKAIVHQIHGLTQKATRLRLKKGSEDQKEKNSLKADSYVEEIQILKKLKADEVSLFALSNLNESDLKTLISKPIISAEAKSMAKLCLRGNMLKAVNDFVSKYSNSLELLENLLSERCNRSEKQNKTKKKKNKNKPKNKNLEDSNKHSGMAVEEITSVNDFSDSSDSIPQLMPIESSMDGKSIEISYSDDSGSENASGDEIMEEDAEEDSDIEEETASGAESPSTSKSPKIKKASHLKPEKPNGVSNEYKKYSEPPKTERKKVDPFFKTSNDTEYFTYCDVESRTVEEKEPISGHLSNHTAPHSEINKRLFRKNFRDNTSVKQQFHYQKSSHRSLDAKSSFKRDFNDRKSFKGSFNDRTYNTSKANKQSHVPRNNKLLNNFKTNGKNQRTPNSERFSGKSEPEIKLHPSWEAKRKLNQPPIPFQGKKIVFND